MTTRLLCTFALLLTPTFLLQAQTSPKAPVVKGGVLDLRNMRGFPAQPVELAGAWEFAAHRFVPPAEREGTLGLFVAVPARWDDVRLKNGRRMGSEGFASYRLRLILPVSLIGKTLTLRVPLVSSAARIYVDGRLILKVGEPGRNQARERPQFRKFVRTFVVRQAVTQVVIHVSNYSHRNGGLRRSFVLGAESAIQTIRERALFFDFFLLGWLMVMALYHFGLFLSRSEDRASLVFGFACLVVAIRGLLTGENYISEMWPGLGFDWRMRLEYLTYYLGTGLVMTFFAVVYGERSKRWALGVFGGACVLFSAYTLVTAPKTFTAILLYFHVVTISVFVYAVFLVVASVRKKRRASLAALIGGLIFIASVVNDMLFAEGALKTGYAGPLGLAAFIISQSYALSILFSSAFAAVKRLSRKLKRTNAAYSRFVPREFLTLLNKNEITDIELGDQVQRQMTMLFTDIRSFTRLSETMTPQENFNFLNSYLKRMTPIIQQQGGIIDKYMGDAIMALFANEPSRAVRAAIDMQLALRSYNDSRAQNGFPAVEVGMGIHTGEIMLGTIGAANRMEGTVISDDVNLASRIEGLTKRFGTQLIVSESTLAMLDSSTPFMVRPLGEVAVKGKERRVQIYEILDGLPAAECQLRSLHKELFTEGVAAFRRGEFQEGQRIFRAILAENPNDGPASWYLESCLRTKSA